MAGKPLALVYFHSSASDMAKDVAARVRNDGGDARLIWAHNFRQPEDLDGEARAVIIQKSLGNAEMIAQTYAAFSAGVEIHFIDDEGVFVSQEGETLAVENATEPAEAEPAAQATDAPVPDAVDSGSGPAEPEDTQGEGSDEGAVPS